MKKRDRKALAEYVRWVANELELRDWTIEVSGGPSPDGTEGYICCVYGRKYATLQVCSDFRGQDRERQRHTIAHELVHCHLDSAGSMVRRDLEEASALSDQADRIFWQGYKRQLEYGVDAIASALAKRLPLIDWPK